MVFNSLTFLSFFGIVLAVHHLPLRWSVRKFNLLAASYLFYAAWNPPFVLLLILAAVVDFQLAKAIGRSTRIGRRRRLLLTVSLVLNLGLLAYFKYGQFLLDNFVRMLGWAGVHYQPLARGIILPLGISFYTFETISYLVDVYRRRITPWHSFLDYALFLTFFPHLVAGPIVRAEDFLPQCAEPRRASRGQMGWGLALLVIGLFEKVILADGVLAPIADTVFNGARQASSTDAWLGALAFSGQIFCDFAGYSTCGIGVALSLGFVLKRNFHFPYAAVGFSDFWQRWHISLSTWLRDYLYIPLGGNRRGRLLTCRNLMLTMLLGGLWHGAAWHFVAWGGLHGLLLAVEQFLKARLRHLAWWAHRSVQFSLALLTFLIVSLSWVFFRAKNIGSALYLMEKMIGWPGRRVLATRYDLVMVLSITAALLAIHWILRKEVLRRVVERIPWWLRGLGLAAAIVCLVLAPGDDRAFIYFQF